MPNVIIIAGPNGAGKSTIAPTVLRGALGVKEFVNADVIARGLSAYDPESVAIAAGRIMLTRLDELAAERADFAFETTLASRSFAPRIRRLIEAGYAFRLIFVWVPVADLSIKRVATRVAMGGHHVDADIVRRRYARGILNFFDLYRPIATSWRLYDNTMLGSPRLVASGKGERHERVYHRTTWQAVRQAADAARAGQGGHREGLRGGDAD